jgi:hypothetical protein
VDNISNQLICIEKQKSITIAEKKKNALACVNFTTLLFIKFAFLQNVKMASGVKIVKKDVVNVIAHRVIILQGSVHEGVPLGLNYLTVLQVSN